MSGRIFSEDEVNKLIKRAAELEAMRTVGGRSSKENGLTIEELKKIAAETGLDPDLIEKAAFEMDSIPDDQKIKARVNREEITSEVWIDQRPDRETIDLMVMELNHIYGTTDDLNWWDTLWGTHEGKAKVTRTTNTTEWNYQTEAGIYSTRVLMQQRGDRFRIRVSKRQIFGMEWDNAINHLYLILPLAVLLGVIGGLSSSAILGMEWPGIIAGIVLSLCTYPFMRHFSRRSVEKHRNEVANTVQQLSNLISQSTTVKKRTPVVAEKSRSDSVIEIPDETDSSETRPDKFRNILRE